MNDYLKNISSIDASSTNVSISPEGEDAAIVLPEAPPTITPSGLVSTESLPIEDYAEYLTPQKIKLKKYTLKKG